MSDTIRKKLTGAKSVDGSCKNGTCPTCRQLREHKRKKREPI